MKPISIIILVAVVAALIITSQSVFTVDQTQQAIVLQLGKPMPGILKPGLHFKLPFIQQVMFFERRLLEYDAPPTEILSRDKKNVVVDNYSRWRIENPLLFFKTVRTEIGARARLDDIIYAQLRVELGKVDFTDIISKKRDPIMVSVTRKSDQIARQYGIEVKDVRIKRADLPEQNERYVFGRMKAERERESMRYRAEGEEEAVKIKTLADRERTILIAEARKKAEELRGFGEAQALKIYAVAYEQDPQFFALYRTLEAYKQSLKEGTTLVISPDTEFFQYLKKFD
ncbi:MAG: protease modulator HflC [Deltaproteobacteria bacterium]|nr:protease modulator HflC [Deltaproteobacteria bacterium]MBW2305797.1 protease modulator HflC [Deltaproteobacteria bacterium]